MPFVKDGDDVWFSETEAMWPGQRFSLKVKKVLHEGKTKFQVCMCRPAGLPRAVDDTPMGGDLGVPHRPPSILKLVCLHPSYPGMVLVSCRFQRYVLGASDCLGRDYFRF